MTPSRSSMRRLYVLPASVLVAILVVVPLSAVVAGCPESDRPRRSSGSTTSSPATAVRSARGPSSARGATRGRCPRWPMSCAPPESASGSTWPAGSVAPAAALVPLTDFGSYDLRRGSYERLPRPCRAAPPLRLVAARGERVRLGGARYQCANLERGSRRAWRYHVGRRRWEEIPPMPTARTAMGAAVVGDRIYAVGGMHRGRGVDAVEAYDLDTGRWSAARRCPGARPPRRHRAPGADVRVRRKVPRA